MVEWYVLPHDAGKMFIVWLTGTFYHVTPVKMFIN